MTKPGAKGGGRMLLRVVGIEEDEEHVYRMLLLRRSATAEEAAADLAMPLATADNLLQRAEAKGLASHSPERPRRYIPTQPDLAVDFLIQQQRVLIENARGAIRALQSLTPQTPALAHEPELVEII